MATVRSSRARIVLRVIGVVLLVVGAVLLVKGVIGFKDAFASDSVDDDPGLDTFLLAAGGGFLIAFGLGALNAGFLGAQASYVADETSPALRTASGAVREGWTGAERSEPAPGGRFCSQCGTRGDADARFCDACGHALG